MIELKIHLSKRGANGSGLGTRLAPYQHLIILLVIALVLRSMWLFSAIERDEGLFGYYGWLLATGRISLLDNMDNKPLGFHLLYALSVTLFGNTIIPMRLFNNLLFFLSIPFYYKLLEMSFDKRVAFVGSVLYIAGMNIPAYEGQLAMTGSLGVPVLVISIYCLVKSHYGSRRLMMGLSLLFSSIATSLRSTMALGFLLIFADIILTARSKGRLPSLKKATFLLCVLLGVMLAIFMGLSMSGWLLETRMFKTFSVRVATILVTLNYIIPAKYIGPVSLIVLEGLFLLAFALPGVIQLIRLLKTGDSSPCAVNIVLFLWFVSSLVVSSLPPMFGHYIIQVIPSISLVAAMGIIHLFDVTRERQPGRILLLLLVGSLVLISYNFQAYHFPHMNSQKIQEGWDWEYSDMRTLGEQKAVAELVRTLTRENETVVVWRQHSLDIPFLSEREVPTVVLNQCLEDGYTPHVYGGRIPLPGIPLDEEFRYYIDVVLGGPLNISIPLVEYNRTNLENYLLNDRGQEVGAVIIPPRHSRMCEGFDKPIFSELVEGWEERRIGGAIIFLRPRGAQDDGAVMP